jgi:hypothetical protein
MRNEIDYQWDIETTDADGDIIDHHHADALNTLPFPGLHESLVLVRDEGNEQEGLVSRSWAYVYGGALPEFFTESDGRRIAKVPGRFHRELKKYLEGK